MLNCSVFSVLQVLKLNSTTMALKEEFCYFLNLNLMFIHLFKKRGNVLIGIVCSDYSKVLYLAGSTGQKLFKASSYGVCWK